LFQEARAGTPRDAAQGGDVLLLAVHWSRVDDVLKQAGDVSGKVIVTCSLPMNAGDTGLVVGGTSSGAEELAKKARGAGAGVPVRAIYGFVIVRPVTVPSVLCAKRMP
jgi:hypothetical protein